MIKNDSIVSKFSIPILNELEEIKKNENNIILFGSVGNGKTFLLNKACGENFLVNDRGYSCTKQVQHAFSIKYNMSFIDFPGLNATQDIVGHLKTQKIALSAIYVRMICFIIKYSPRNDDFERELGQMLFIFDKYLQNILIIITKSENIDMKRKEEIKFLFQNKFKINNVLFTSINTSPEELCESLYNIKETMQNIKEIIIKTRDLAKNLPSLYDPHMAKEREEYEDKFLEAIDIFTKEFNKTKSHDLKRALYFALKDYKRSLLEEYANELRLKQINNLEMDIDILVAEVLMFDNKIFNEFDDFRKKVENEIEVKLNNYNGEYNKFKKCPHCGQIWFKIKGCNSVICGRRSTIEDKIIGRYKNYEVIYEDKQIIINWEDLGEKLDKKKNYSDHEFNGLTKEEENENIIREGKGMIKIKPVGCGRNLKWDEMEDCSEEVINKLKEIAVDDYFSGFLEISKKYGK